tara:strand:+ start:43 stop:1101 length:1059 start_codon:yes stop_codon:yes gene_type:complete
MLCCAISQIITGPISDYYGRRQTALVCLLLFIIGSIGGYYSTNVNEMVICRVTQAFGASGTFLCAYATVRDLYPKPEDSARMYSYINICISQSPILAPTLGGIIAKYYNWPYVFIFMLGISIITLIITATMYYDTCPNHQKPDYAFLKKSYLSVLSHACFKPYTLASSTGMASFFMFFSQSPYIIMDTLGYDETLYGMFFGLVGITFCIASFMTPKVCRKHSTHGAIEIGCCIMTIGGLLIILAEKAFGTSIAGFIIPMMIISSGAAICIGAGLAGIMQPFGHIAGTAFSAVGFFKFFISAVLGRLLMQMDPDPLFLGILVLSFSAISLYTCLSYSPSSDPSRYAHATSEYE